MTRLFSRVRDYCALILFLVIFFSYSSTYAQVGGWSAVMSELQNRAQAQAAYEAHVNRCIEGCGWGQFFAGIAWPDELVELAYGNCVAECEGSDS